MFVPNFSIFLYTDGSQIWSLNLPNTRYELILIYSVKKIQRHVLAQFDPQCMGSVTLILYTKSNPIHKNVGLSMGLMQGGGGGVGYYHIAYWVGLCAARETPIFQAWISVPEHVIFTNFPKIRSGASPFYTLGPDFAVPGPSFSKFL